MNNYPRTTKLNMKDSLIEWLAYKENISFKQARLFINILRKNELAFNVFMADYWTYFKLKSVEEAELTY